MKYIATSVLLLQQSDLEKAEFLLKQALLEDERDRTDDAEPLYMDAAELCLKAVSCSLLDSRIRSTLNDLSFTFNSPYI